MNALASKALLLTAAVCAALLVWTVVSRSTSVEAAATTGYQMMGVTIAPGAPDLMQADVAATPDSSRENVQTWTVLAAGGAAAIGLVLFFVRLAMGWVKPAPPPEETLH